MNILRRIWWAWQWRGVGVLVAAFNIALIAAFAARDIASPSWTVLLVASSTGSVAALLFFVDKAHRQRDDREEALRGVRELGKKLAIYDRETGLYAYWYFNLRLEEEMVRCGRYGQSFALLLVEAARSRMRRDEEGLLFRTMAQCFRASDLVAHLGNLRFLVLLVGTDAEGATVVCNRLRADRRLGDATVNFASYPADGADCEALLTAAGAPANVVDEARGGISSVLAGRDALTGSSGDEARGVA